MKPKPQLDRVLVDAVYWHMRRAGLEKQSSRSLQALYEYGPAAARWMASQANRMSAPAVHAVKGVVTGKIPAAVNEVQQALPAIMHPGEFVRQLASRASGYGRAAAGRLELNGVDGLGKRLLGMLPDRARLSELAAAGIDRADAAARALRNGVLGQSLREAPVNVSQFLKAVATRSNQVAGAAPAAPKVPLPVLRSAVSAPIRAQAPSLPRPAAPLPATPAGAANEAFKARILSRMGL